MADIFNPTSLWGPISEGCVLEPVSLTIRMESLVSRKSAPKHEDTPLSAPWTPQPWAPPGTLRSDVNGLPLHGLSILQDSDLFL